MRARARALRAPRRRRRRRRNHLQRVGCKRLRDSDGIVWARARELNQESRRLRRRRLVGRVSDRRRLRLRSRRRRRRRQSRRALRLIRFLCVLFRLLSAARLSLNSTQLEPT